MFERFATFDDYVREYGLQRSEGVLLRYLSDAYKTLAQTVPEAARDEAVEEALQSLPTHGAGGGLEPDRRVGAAPAAGGRTRRPGDSLRRPGGSDGPGDLGADPIELHRLLKAIAEKAWDDALACLAPGHGWTAESLASETASYFAAHERIVLIPEARRPSMAVVRSDAPGRWEARQKILSPDGEADWMLDCSVALEPGPASGIARSSSSSASGSDGRPYAAIRVPLPPMSAG